MYKIYRIFDWKNKYFAPNNVLFSTGLKVNFFNLSCFCIKKISTNGEATVEVKVEVPAHPDLWAGEG